MKRGGIVRALQVSLLFELAFALMTYPFISNYLFENRADSIVNTVEQAVQESGEAERKQKIEEAKDYNRVIAGGNIQLKDPFIEEQVKEEAGEYPSLLSMTDEGVMGSVEIPLIRLSLPIFHGTSEEVLKRGAGHLQGTSLPIGGESTHAVLTGHTGLSSAKLFTDLTELEEDDYFFLNMLGEKLAYRIDQIKVVRPNEWNDLRVESGKDYCTLVTCTPYGINTHRLLVRGVRTEDRRMADQPKNFQEREIESKWMAEYKFALLISVACFAAGFVIFIIIRRNLLQKRMGR